MKATLFWLLAFIITAGTAVVQRMTGPSYPESGSVLFGDSIVEYRFDRSHAGESDAPVVLEPPPDTRATLLWKRYKTNDAWTETPMQSPEEGAGAFLPNQPPAGKLQYQVRLENDETSMLIPPEPVVIRYRGEVPLFVLVPHIIAMFGAMFLSTRTGLEYFNPAPSYKILVLWTFGFLIVGGFILGPWMQLYSFGVPWTGWPVGSDLTDNKTVVALLGWIAAAVALRKSSSPGRWVLAASVITLIVYLIPHSLLGSELDYSAPKP